MQCQKSSEKNAAGTRPLQNTFKDALSSKLQSDSSEDTNAKLIKFESEVPNTLEGSPSHSPVLSEAAGTADARPKRSKLVTLLCRLFYDMMLLCVILSTVLGVVTNNNKQLIRGSPKPKPFLPKLRVRDYYQGNVFQAFRDAGEYENSLLMFYAPWDRESIQARAVLADVASFFSQTDIMIAAINCWYPTSDCAKEFGSKTASSQFPVFIFYPGRLKGIQYRGILRSDHLISWLQRCRYPLSIIQDLDHFHALQTVHSSLLVGFLPLTIGSQQLDPNHVPLLGTAYSLLESYPDASIAVAVTTESTLGRLLHLHQSHPVRLFTWNSTHVYPNKTVDSTKIHMWAARHTTVPSAWLRLPGRKSLVLQKMLGGQSLLVFTGHNSLHPSSVGLAVREISTRYRDCNFTQQARDQVVYIKRSQANKCNSKPTCEMNINSYCHLKSFTTESNGGAACRLTSWHNTSDTCSIAESKPFLGVDDEVQFLVEEYRTETRNLNKFENTNGWISLEEESNDEHIDGLGCSNNATLNILTVDTDVHHSLAEVLGVRQSARPQLVIVSPHEESIVYRSTEYHKFKQTLRSMILSWHRGEFNSEPGLRSSERLSSFFHGVTNPRSEDSALEIVEEVTRDNFYKSVIVSNSSTVLFYSSTFCTYCSVASFVFHTVARLLADVGLQFKIVDASKNDLPWQYTALAYPSVLFFPRLRSENSRVFPTHKELNTTNLLAFIVSNLKPVERLRLALKSCDNLCLTKVRLAASSTLGNLERVSRRRALVGRRGKRLQQQIKYAKTVLYVVTAWVNSSELEHSEVSDRYTSAIIDSFIESRESKQR